MSLVLFFILLLGYAAAFLGAEQRQDKRVLGAWWPASIVVAFATGGVFLWILFSAELSKSATQIAWVGMSTRQGEDSLDLGGSRQQATIGWPNGAFSPAVSLKASAENEAGVTVSGGSGFVRGPQGFLNGVPFGGSERAQIGAFALEADSLPGRLCLRCTVKIRILDSSGNKVAQIEPRVGAGARVSSLYSNLTVDIARLRKTDGGAAQALESWSSNLRLLVSRTGLRVLAPDTAAVTAQVPLPAELTVYWAGQSQPVELRAAGERRIEATFLPPWRLASPLPEPTREGDAHLTLESRALPGDSAFLLPLGGGLSAFNETVSLKNARFARPDRNAHTQEFAKVLSQQTEFAGKYALRFASIHDLPSWPRVLAALLIALSIYSLGLWLASARVRPRDGWVLGGILASVWTILLIRLLLAFRYSLDPAHFDQFAFAGVATAMRALCIVPALILIAARVRRDRAALSTFNSNAERASAGKRVLAYGVAIAVASAAVTWLAHSLWPNVEQRYGHATFNLGLLFTVALAAAAMLWGLGYLFFLYFYDPEREAGERLREQLQWLRSKLSRRFTENFALEQSGGFWRHLGSTLDDEDEYDRRD